MVGIDLAKDFDTVSIHSITRALKRQSVDDKMINYIINAYSGANTVISCGNVKISNVKLLRGVKQGDPLSPFLFNLILDELLDQLPNAFGVSINNTEINSLAFADDLILLAESKVGTNHLLSITTKFFDDRNMKINGTKCFSLRTDGTKKNRAPITISSAATYKINGVHILACGYDNSFKYLGIRFNPTGKLSSNIKELNLLLERLKKSPLKPQQKLLLLRQNVLPKLCHRLVLGRITKGLLENFDQKIRHFVRDITDLPHDTTNAFFYTPTKLGGLGIMDLKSSIPLSILRRLKKMESSNDTAVKALLSCHTITSLQQTCVTLLLKP